MSEFETLLAEYVTKDNPKVHGVIAKVVDGKGNLLYNKVAGWHSLAPDAKPLQDDVVLKLGSATKLITSIALLQCIDNGLIGLDESIAKVIPELDGVEILKDIQGTEEIYEKCDTPITPRLLLTHTSGLGHKFTNRLLGMRARLRAEAGQQPSFIVHERFNMPLVFEPGTSWLYGCGVDWAGVIVRRLNGNILLGITLRRIFGSDLALKLHTPHSTLEITLNTALGLWEQQQDPLRMGSLQAQDTWSFDNPVDSDGGSGLAATTRDYVAVISDLVSESPKLLKKETVDQMFTPQLEPNSNSTKALIALRVAWDTVAGPIKEEYANHGLGGFLSTGEVPEIKQPKGILGWGGTLNVVWWTCRDKGIAGFFATQQSPFGNPSTHKLVNAWKKDFWTNYEAEQ